MMIHKSHDIDATEESFRFHLKKQIFIMSMLIISGIAILVLLRIGKLGETSGHAGGFLTGFAGSIAIAGIIKLIMTIRCLRIPEKFGKAYTEYADERNRFVLMKTYYYSAYIFFLLLALSTIVVNILGMPSVISRTLAMCIFAFALILAVTYRIMNKKY